MAKNDDCGSFLEGFLIVCVCLCLFACLYVESGGGAKMGFP